MKGTKIIRDISWLSFNERVLQEAKDSSVPISERLRFLGIFSNNLDEFFRVRVATLNRMTRIGKNAKMYLEDKPAIILKHIQQTVLVQQKEFETIYKNILVELKRQKILLVNEQQLNKDQKIFVEQYFNQYVRTNISPLMIESIPELPLLHDKSIYLACILSNSKNSFMNSYAIIEVPTQQLPRFVILPSKLGEHAIILLEDIIRFCLPKLFTQFGFNIFEGYIFKVTRDAELDIDNDIHTDLIQGLHKGLKNRKKGKAVRFVYDKNMQKNLLDYLIKLLNLNRRDHLVPGGRIHNFKDFMDFPEEVFNKRLKRPASLVHPLLTQPIRILEVLEQRDVMLHFPYHSFDSVIDLLRESAIDPFVESIKITGYRLAKNSKIINALINAVRNGKQVTVVIELRARFDEEANMKWKQVLEEEGVKVLTGFPNMKIHAKICLISKRVGKALKHYGFVSTGNLNESTARFYGDHCLLTADKRILDDVKNIFRYIEHPINIAQLKTCKHLIVSPVSTRDFIVSKLTQSLKAFKKGEKVDLILKLNSLSDNKVIDEIYALANAGVPMHLIIRGICCAHTTHTKWPQDIHAISIVDQYLEHARVFQFTQGDKDELFISSADWMQRNIDYRIEVTAPIFNEDIKQELKDILQIQLGENKKARILDNDLNNHYVAKAPKEKVFCSQEEIHKYLSRKKY